jgi:hypothetical protein
MTKQLHLIASTCALLMLGACSDTAVTKPAAEPVTIIGETKPLGNAAISTFARIDAGGTLTAIGATFGAGALTGLPAAPTEITLAMPSSVSVAPFTFFAVNWNPAGHPPPGIYTVPHFDFHFYTISDSARMAIAGGPVTSSPPAGAVPPGYVVDPVTIPMMGTHYTDSTAPEFSGQPFTATFVYGYNGTSLAFLEPMVALSFLASKQGYEAAIKQPSTYQVSGMFPTHYSVGYNPVTNAYTLTMDGLVKR